MTVYQNMSFLLFQVTKMGAIRNEMMSHSWQAGLSLLRRVAVAEKAGERFSNEFDTLRTRDQLRKDLRHPCFLRLHFFGPSVPERRRL